MSAAFASKWHSRAQAFEPGGGMAVLRRRSGASEHQGHVHRMAVSTELVTKVFFIFVSIYRITFSDCVTVEIPQCPKKEENSNAISSTKHIPHPSCFFMMGKRQIHQVLELQARF